MCSLCCTIADTYRRWFWKVSPRVDRVGVLVVRDGVAIGIASYRRWHISKCTNCVCFSLGIEEGKTGSSGPELTHLQSAMDPSRSVPALVETFVERARFRRTVYRAANWQPLGETRGAAAANPPRHNGCFGNAPAIVPRSRRATTSEPAVLSSSSGPSGSVGHRTCR